MCTAHPSLHLFHLPSPFAWNSLSILSFSEVKWWTLRWISGTDHRDSCLGCRSGRIFSSVGMVPSWHQLSSATWLCFLCGFRYYFKFRDKKKRRVYFHVAFIIVPYVNCGIIYLHVLHYSEAPLETTRRWLGKKTRPAGSPVWVII